MKPFKPYPEIVVVEGQVDSLFRLETSKGKVIISGHFANRADAERIATCWNALRPIAFPEAHMAETEAYVKRLEKLRREALATREAAE